MLHDLDNTLAELLKRFLPLGLVDQVCISFATPDAQFPHPEVTLPAIDLFLHQVREDRDLRGAGNFVERANGRALMTPAPVRIECHYLVTAWAKAGVTHPEQDEHRLLGEAMRVLLRFRELPTDVLQGSLRYQPVPVRALALPASDPPQARGEFWQALGGRPKASFAYVVTIAVDLQDEPRDIGPVVEDVQIDLKVKK